MSYYKNLVPFPRLFVYFQRTFLVSRAVEWSCLQYRASLPHPRLTMLESFCSNMSAGKISSLWRDFISETWINSLGNITPGKNALKICLNPDTIYHQWSSTQSLPAFSRKTERQIICHFFDYSMAPMVTEATSSWYAITQWSVNLTICSDLFSPVAEHQIIMLIPASKTIYFKQPSSAKFNLRSLW